ncbi:SMI1/KNR4 family protein [Ciceribacter sp. RN22]|uniref:SMI1/KNR4 family protein n=1 Tax=Ciceribacter sp. RN22 TaxID=2954932 RepID=UPI002093A19D|nr:SMI1/KNR4 family protein [Ciceribacter sp. RN22]MCO6180762.1 SMI1/KNR4 family protein [Ciceribacter sp. RN22]
MAISIEDVIDEINQADDPGGRKRPLPDDGLIKEYEKDTGFTFPEDYKLFLKSVSNAFVGYISPFTLSVGAASDYGDLRVGLAEARKAGVPEDWLPVCEDNGDFYCIVPDGRVRFWDHNGSTDESWPNLATWAKEVWLEGG